MARDSAGKANPQLTPAEFFVICKRQLSLLTESSLVVVPSR